MPQRLFPANESPSSTTSNPGEMPDPPYTHADGRGLQHSKPRSHYSAAKDDSAVRLFYMDQRSIVGAGGGGYYPESTGIPARTMAEEALLSLVDRADSGGTVQRQALFA